jgi:hypothetical protein
MDAFISNPVFKVQRRQQSSDIPYFRIDCPEATSTTCNFAFYPHGCEETLTIPAKPLRLVRLLLLQPLFSAAAAAFSLQWRRQQLLSQQISVAVEFTADLRLHSCSSRPQIFVFS